LVGPLPDEPYVVAVEAIRKRDSLFERLAADGEWVPERGEDGDMPAVQPLLVTAAFFLGSSAEFVGRKPGFLCGALPRTPRFMSHGTGISLSLSA
jgi:hypothetical protein